MIPILDIPSFQLVNAGASLVAAVLWGRVARSTYTQHEDVPALMAAVISLVSWWYTGLYFLLGAGLWAPVNSPVRFFLHTFFPLVLLPAIYVYRQRQKMDQLTSAIGDFASQDKVNE